MIFRGIIFYTESKVTGKKKQNKSSLKMTMRYVESAWQQWVLCKIFEKGSLTIVTIFGIFVA